MLKRANALYLKKKYRSAIKIYERILQLDSTNFPATANTATAYFEIQQFDKSIPFLKKTITMDSGNPWWYNYLSQALQKCGDSLSALDNAWMAVLYGEDDNAHHLNLAYTIYEASEELEHKKTDSFLKKWYKKYPQNPIAEQCFKSYFYDKNFTASNPEYVEELFDAFASDFDNVLAELNYDSPNIIAQYLSEYFDKKKNENLTILDIGCGSGLCGECIKKIFKKSVLTGVDISSQMLIKAGEKNVYNKLVKSDIISCFCNKNSAYDVVVASDVLTYFGDLDSIFKKVDSLIYKNGVFIFTISENKMNKNDFFLMSSSRFVHTSKYVESVVKKFEFKVIKKAKKVLRKEGEKDVEGIIYLVKKQ